MKKFTIKKYNINHSIIILMMRRKGNSQIK